MTTTLPRRLAPRTMTDILTPAMHKAYAHGTCAGFVKGYFRGWRLGLAAGALIGLYAAWLAAWLLHKFDYLMPLLRAWGVL